MYSHTSYHKTNTTVSIATSSSTNTVPIPHCIDPMDEETSNESTNSDDSQDQSDPNSLLHSSPSLNSTASEGEEEYIDFSNTRTTRATGTTNNQTRTLVKQRKAKVYTSPAGRKAFYYYNHSTHEYQCGFKGCGKSYLGRHSNIIYHLLSYHLKERPYKCSQCGLAFFQNADRKRHEENVCQISFKTRSLSMHSIQKRQLPKTPITSFNQNSPITSTLKSTSTSTSTKFNHNDKSLFDRHIGSTVPISTQSVTSVVKSVITRPECVNSSQIVMASTNGNGTIATEKVNEIRAVPPRIQFKRANAATNQVRANDFRALLLLAEVCDRRVRLISA